MSSMNACTANVSYGLKRRRNRIQMSLANIGRKLYLIHHKYKSDEG